METITKYADCRCVFPVSAEVVTEESADQGHCLTRGYIDSLGRWDDHFERYGTYPDDDGCGWQLSTLLEDLKHRHWEQSGAGRGSTLPDYIVTDSTGDDFLTREGDWSVWEPLVSTENALWMSVYVHRPVWITCASWGRVLRMLGVKS